MDLKWLGERLGKFEESAAQFAILIITLALYLVTSNAIFGVLVAVEFLAFVALEIQQGVKHHGLKSEVVDTLKSLAIVVVLWLALSTFLGTAVPMSAIVSCSMLPNLQRGDMVIIKGAHASDLTAPQINVSDVDLAAIASPQAQVTSVYGNRNVSGSIYSYCQRYLYTDAICNSFLNDPSAFRESRGGLAFSYSSCQRKILGSNVVENTPCVTSFSYAGKTYGMNLSDSIIVYQALGGDLFAQTGDIIHRVQLKISAPSGNYLLTKGDNNNVFDVQFYSYTDQLSNHPVIEKNIRGMHLFSIPYIGYFKLFISGFVQEDAACGTNLIY